jgi:hypothetical protein
MGNAERWVSVQEVVQGVMDVLCCPLGPAQAALIEACSAGLVRARELTPLLLGPRLQTFANRLDRERWTSDREKLFQCHIQFNLDDFTYWLEQRSGRRIVIQDADRQRLKACPLADYRKHWNAVVKDIGKWPSGEEDEDWAKAEGYSIDSVRKARRETIARFPLEVRNIMRGGPRSVLPSKTRRKLLIA